MREREQQGRVGKDGFTLIELLIAMVVLSFLVVLLSSLVGGVSRAWSAGERQAETFQNGRAILNLMCRDLSQAVISPRLQFIHNPGSLNSLLTGSTTQVAESDAIFLQTISSGDPLGDVSEVGYYLTHRKDSTGNDHFELLRLFVPPTDPSKLPAAVQANPAYHIYDSPSPVVYNTSSSLPPSIMPSWVKLNGTTFSGSTRTDFEYFSTVVSDGVVGLWIRCLDGNGEPIDWLSSADVTTTPIKFNSTAHFQSSIPSQAASFKYLKPNTTAQANLLPAAIEITITTLDSRTFARRPAIPPMPVSVKPSDVPGNIGLMNQSLITQRITSARTFSTTVTLKNAQP